MKQLWIVAQHEFMVNIRRRSFWLAVLGFPVLIAGIMLLVGVVTASAISSGEVDVSKIGYVDSDALLAPADLPATWIAYPDTASADAAIAAETVDGYFVVDESFFQTGNITLYANGTATEDLNDTIKSQVTRALVAQADSTVPAERLEQPVTMQMFIVSTGRALTEATFVVWLLVPFVFVLIFMISMQIGSSYLMTSVVEEKTNRVMELLITTVTPNALLAGKIIGLGALSLIQIGVWLGLGVAGLALSSRLDGLSGIAIPWDMVVLALVFFVLTYFLYGSILAGIGALVDGDQESRQIAGIISLVLVIPIFALSTFLEDSNGTIPVFLSYFPFTSGMAMLMRVVLGNVSFPELLLSLGILIATSLAVVLMAARVFKWGLLMYGKRITPRTLWQVIRQNPGMGGAV